MSHLSIEELRQSLGPVPSAEEVRAQTIEFYPRHWIDNWPDHLSAHMPKMLRDSSQETGKLSISREDVFGFRSESKWTADTVVAFYVAVCAWGTGVKAQSVHRALKPLLSRDAPERLLAGLQGASTASPETMYYGFHNFEEHKLADLGPAFFTKLMYFAAGKPTVGARRPPLILDSNVAKGLGWKRDEGWRSTAGNESYKVYLDLVEDMRADGAWSEVPADCLEYALFRDGSGK